MYVYQKKKLRALYLAPLKKKKAVKRDKEEHYIMIKVSIHEGDMSYKYVDPT